MKSIYKVVLLVLAVLMFGALLTYVSYGTNLAVLDPKGPVAASQRDLIVIVTLLMLIVVIPVFVLTFVIVWKYRATNTRAAYTPNADHNGKLEALWWGIPFLIIAILSVIIWTSSQELDPYKPIASKNQPVRVQVVALQWKWLFLYPEQNIASVNFLQFPKDTPISFEVTADAPVNSFWIPQLGGQIYAMSGMSTKLHLIANEAGDFNGSSANISGEGFSGMRFVARSTSQAEFDAWVQSVKQSDSYLSYDEYKKLAEPSKNNSPMQYSSSQEGLYDAILMKYMMPDLDQQTNRTSNGATMNGQQREGE